MNNKSPSLPTTETVLQKLRTEGYTVNDDKLPLSNEKSTVAWYQHILLAIGVFATFVGFFLLLLVSEFWNLGTVGQSLWALAFIVTGIIMYHRVIDGEELKSEKLLAAFVTQVTFVLILVGESLLIYEISHYFSLTEPWQLVLLTGALTAIVFPLYPVMLARVVQVTMIFLFVQILPMSLPFVGSSAWILQSLLLLFFLVGLVYLAFSLRWLNWHYLCYALIISILAQLTFSSHMAVTDIMRLFITYGFHYTNETPVNLTYPSWIVATVLCGCVVYLAGEKRRFYGIWLLCLACFVLANFLPATLFFTLLLLVLGYATREKIMTGLGLILMPYYLFDYYYTLKLSLLEKSLLLMASGVVLLAVAFAVAKLPHYQERKGGNV